jgi:hypothetical protein
MSFCLHNMKYQKTHFGLISPLRVKPKYSCNARDLQNKNIFYFFNGYF